MKGVRIRVMNCRKMATAMRVLLGKETKPVSPEARAKSAVRTLARVRETEPSAWEGIAADLEALVVCDCPPTGHPLTAATREERGKELVARLKDVVVRVSEVGEGTGDLSATAKGAAALAAREVVLAVGRLATPGDIATGVVRSA